MVYQLKWSFIKDRIVKQIFAYISKYIPKSQKKAPKLKCVDKNNSQSTSVTFGITYNC